MADLILHHFSSSPFAEKIRCILGFKGLAWDSVEIPRVPPKPDVVALTGGYRRTPILQIGADVFCDTVAIAHELERRHPSPTLFPSPSHGVAAILGAWAEKVLFFDVVGTVFGTHAAQLPQDLKDDRRRFSDGLLDADRFAADQPHVRGQLRSHLFWVEHCFDDGRAFLTGDAPSYADFCLYPSVWMLRGRVPDLGLLDPLPRVQAWMQRIEAFGHGTPTTIASEDAIWRARNATPEPPHLTHPDTLSGFAAGDRVAIAPDDYGKDPVEGALVALSAQHVVVERTDPRAGTVRVHFPRAGYRLTRFV
jgi:glutathione S-transferase